MKVIDLYDKACILATGAPCDELLKKAGIGFINTILLDLGKSTVSLLGEDIELEEAATTTLINGTAMLICLYLGDDSGMSALCEVYNSLRRRLLGGTSRVRNTLFGGDI